MQEIKEVILSLSILLNNNIRRDNLNPEEIKAIALLTKQVAYLIQTYKMSTQNNAL